MQIDLTVEDQATLARLLQSGRFESAQQIVHAGLQHLEDEEESNRRIRLLVQEGIESARNEPLVTEEQLLQRLAERRQKQA